MIRKRSAGWKQLLQAQAPYRWHVRKLCPGRTLDIGCGIGRNLEHLGDRAVGVDHNEICIQTARSRGLNAYTSKEFGGSPDAVAESFDYLLFAHVLEHLAPENAVGLVQEYLPFLKPGGGIVIITPQERGYATDATHVNFLDHAGQRRIAEEAGLEVTRQYSFPLPRLAGKIFAYNEFVAVVREKDGRRAASAGDSGGDLARAVPAGEDGDGLGLEVDVRVESLDHPLDHQKG